MNWEAIGALGEIVGALAVVASLGYLAVQIRSQNRESRWAAMHDVASAFRAAAGAVADPDRAQIMMRGIEDFDQLTGEERYVIMALWLNIWRVCEEAFILYEEGRLDERYWAAIERYLASVASIPAMRRMWVMRRHYFDEAFQRYMEQLEPGQWTI